MSETIGDLLAAVRRDLSFAQSKITAITQALDAQQLRGAPAEQPRPGSPRELAPGCCPVCHVGSGGHTDDCEEDGG